MIVQWVDVTGDAWSDSKELRLCVEKRLRDRISKRAEQEGLEITEIKIEDKGTFRDNFMFAPFEIGEVIDDDGGVWTEESQKRWEEMHRIFAYAR